MKTTSAPIPAARLDPADHAHASRLLGREPSSAEIAILSAMWSEHCSYRHTRALLATLPTEGPRVLHGPGENAGVIGIGGALACVFKIESHNHPSAVEPFQGAATGVGGILRDIFAMGAFPVAVLDSLRFGPLTDAKCRATAQGVAEGIADYSNCIGVPCIGGELSCDPAYTENCLVNVMAVGIARADSLMTTRGAQVGDLLLCYGGLTAREGVNGASFASKALGDDAPSAKSAVQIADPFMGKRILEASLELIEADVLSALQDMGAAGLTCSSTELAHRAGLGVELDLDQVPRGCDAMSAEEILLSESQERMLAAISRASLERAMAILAKWDIPSATVGYITDHTRAVVRHGGEVVADMPLAMVCDGFPAAGAVTLVPSRPEMTDWSSVDFSKWSWNDVLIETLSSANFSSKRWIHERFDWQVQLNSIVGPERGTAVVRVRGEQSRSLAFTVDGNGLLCALDPREGTKCIVAEAARNLVIAGARPVAATNNLNFGSPRNGEVAWQISEAIAGLGEACRALGTPITGGNVSLYNESPRGPILPTPVVGMVGIIEDITKSPRAAFAGEGDAIVLVGPRATHCGGSRVLRDRLGGFYGPAVTCDLAEAARVNDLVLACVGEGLIAGATDIAEGGLLVALAEMALAGDLGFRVRIPEGANVAVELLSEEPSRFVISASHESLPDLLAMCSGAGIPARVIGRVTADVAEVAHHLNMPMSRLRAAWECTP